MGFLSGLSGLFSGLGSIFKKPSGATSSAAFNLSRDSGRGYQGYNGSTSAAPASAGKHTSFQNTLDRPSTQGPLYSGPSHRTRATQQTGPTPGVSLQGGPQPGQANIGASALGGRGSDMAVRQAQRVPQPMSRMDKTMGFLQNIMGVQQKPGGGADWGKTAGEAMKGPIGQAAVGMGAQALFGGNKPSYPDASEIYGGAEQFAKRMMNVGAEQGGLTFDENGNITGYNPEAMPAPVKNAIAQIEQIEQQNMESLRSEAARAGMLNSSQYTNQVQMLQAEATRAKENIYQQYISEFQAGQNQRYGQAMQLAGQFGSPALQQFDQEYGEYQQRQQGIGGAVSGFYDWLRQKQDIIRAQEEAERERQFQQSQAKYNWDRYQGQRG